jgi:hypothetical protein
MGKSAEFIVGGKPNNEARPAPKFNVLPSEQGSSLGTASSSLAQISGSTPSK